MHHIDLTTNVFMLNETLLCISERTISPKRKFLAGRPGGHPAKNFRQALQILEKEQAFWHGHAARTCCADVHEKTSV